MKRRGFTLIELLAVIVILGIIMIIAIPSVTSYITNSRKDSYILDAKMFADAAKTMLTANSMLPQGENQKVVVPISEIKLDKGGEKSPYGNDWNFENSFVVVENIGTSSDPEYVWSVALEDSKGNCIPNIGINALTRNFVGTECNIKNPGNGAVNKIVKLAKTNTNELQIDDFGNVRYYDRKANNYVTFNGEKAGWRILGVINVDGIQKVKLVRNSSIGSFAWDTSPSNLNSGMGYNNWNDADLMKLMNPGYESETIGGSLYWNTKSGNCYSEEDNTYNVCDFSVNGLTDEAKSMIAKSTFYLGGIDSLSITAKGVYESERSNNLSSANLINTWQGFVGIINLSDLAYSINMSVCKDVEIKDYNDYFSQCGSYLTGDSGNYSWLLTHQYTVNQSNYMHYGPDVIYSSNSFRSRSVFPTVYLTPDVMIISGTGTQTDPFILSK